MLKKQWFYILPVLLVVLVVFPFEGAKSEPGGSSLEGVVKNERDAPVHAAVVKAKDLETGVATVVLTDPQGKFWIPQLRKGKYEITVDKLGYKSEISQQNVDGQLKGKKITLVSLPTVPVAQLNNAEFNHYLPDGPGKATLVELCGYCHSLRTVFEKGGRSRSEWSELVHKMLAVGDYAGSSEWLANVRLADVDTGPIVDYLSKNYGPGSTLPQQVGERAKK